MSENLCILNQCNACCTCSRLKLAIQEVNLLRELGTILIAPFFFDGRRNILRGNDSVAYYDMEGRCTALLFTGLCCLYNQQTRPQACSNLMPGSNYCLEIREEQGLGLLKHE